MFNCVPGGGLLSPSLWCGVRRAPPPHIVQLFEVIEAPQSVYLVLEYLPNARPGILKHPPWGGHADPHTPMQPPDPPSFPLSLSDPRARPLLVVDATGEATTAPLPEPACRRHFTAIVDARGTMDTVQRKSGVQPNTEAL